MSWVNEDLARGMDDREGIISTVLQYPFETLPFLRLLRHTRGKAFINPPAEAEEQESGDGYKGISRERSGSARPSFCPCD